MSDHATVVTERLILSAADPEADVDALYPIFADPDGWWYDPTGRHQDVARTRDWLRSAQRRWPLDGLSYWTVRLRDADATVIGVGGAQRHVGGSWNLNYRPRDGHVAWHSGPESAKRRKLYFEKRCRSTSTDARRAIRST